MIYGIGTDLCDVGRIEKSIARPAFLQHVYTPAEQELIAAHTGKKQAETAAANFAAKEAFLKACGTGLSGFSMAEIAALRSGASTEYPDGVSPKKKAIAAYLREHPGVSSKSLIARELHMDRSTVQRYYDEIREEFQRQG